MAQRNNPANRVPDNPLAGVLRALNQQARYSDRRRTGVPTITSQDVATGGSATDGTSPMATPAASQGTVLTTDATGRATIAYGPFAATPAVVATVYRSSPAVAVVETIDGSSATVRVFDLAAAPVASVQVGVYYTSQ